MLTHIQTQCNVHTTADAWPQGRSRRQAEDPAKLIGTSDAHDMKHHPLAQRYQEGRLSPGQDQAHRQADDQAHADVRHAAVVVQSLDTASTGECTCFDQQFNREQQPGLEAAAKVAAIKTVYIWGSDA